MVKDHFISEVDSLKNSNNYSVERMKALDYAKETFGIEEIVGPKHNSWIVNLFKKVGAGWYTSDETPWCGAFAADLIFNSIGKRLFEKTWTAVSAKSYLTVGKKIGLIEAKPMDLVVISRDAGKGHHVAFLWNYDENYIYLFGGNQGNKTGVSKFSISRLIRIADLDSI